MERERGFSSGPVVGIGSGLLLSPFDHHHGLNEKGSSSSENVKKMKKKLKRSFSHNGYGFENKPRKQTLKKTLKRVFSNSIVSIKGYKKNENANGADFDDVEDDDIDDNYLDGGGCGRELLMESENLQWAQGRAGEDRVHIVISEENGWVFVGIYDGFNGPDATDYLLDNLFYAVHDELKLKGLLCGHKSESMAASIMGRVSLNLEDKVLGLVKANDGCCSSFNKENYSIGNDIEKLMNSRNSCEEVRTKEILGWKSEGGRDSVEVFSHSDVLLALSEALRKTEDSFMKIVDEMISNNPVLAMMGSCVLVMLMKGDVVYLMNVGDSRAVLATTQAANCLQLTMEHSTLVKEVVLCAT